MKFAGTVEFRSSRPGRNGAPGEAVIHRLNPGREEKICAATEWMSLQPGSLNLKVDRGVVESLADLVPLVEESAAEVRYPEGWQDIPERRRAYWYFDAVARVDTDEAPVLVRRAANPIPRRVELFAPVMLTDTLELTEGDTVEVEVRARRRRVG